MQSFIKHTFSQCRSSLLLFSGLSSLPYCLPCHVSLHNYYIIQNLSIPLSIYIVPAEHMVISKERRSGSYHLSAYYLAKGLSLVILFPSLYYVISYWCSGINGWTSFFGMWFIILVNSLVSQVYNIVG